MKNIRNISAVSLFFIATILFTGGCEGILEEDVIEEGSYMFWSNFDGPPIDIYIDGRKYGSITGFYTEAPECGTSGCVTVTLEPGSYELYAVEQTINGPQPREWHDFFTIRLNACGKKGLSGY